VVGVLLGFQIEDQRLESENAKRSGREHSAFKTGRRAFVQNFFRRAGRVPEIVRNLVEESLDARRSF
jgi:hypothetical protein